MEFVGFQVRRHDSRPRTFGVRPSVGRAKLGNPVS